MNLENSNLVELSASEKAEIIGGSWLSRQWDSVKAYFEKLAWEYQQSH